MARVMINKVMKHIFALFGTYILDMVTIMRRSLLMRSYTWHNKVVICRIPAQKPLMYSAQQQVLPTLCTHHSVDHVGTMTW